MTETNGPIDWAKKLPDRECDILYKQWRGDYGESAGTELNRLIMRRTASYFYALGAAALAARPQESAAQPVALTFAAFRNANVARCLKWHPGGIESWSPSDWLTAVTGELGELASLLKMRNRERDGLPGNKFSPSDKMVADEIADVLTYLDLLAAALHVDLGAAAVSKFNEISERVGFPDRIVLAPPPAETPAPALGEGPGKWREDAPLCVVGCGNPDLTPGGGCCMSPPAPGDALTDAVRDVLAERARQVSVEGWTPEHDDEHVDGELALVASVYADPNPAMHDYFISPEPCPRRWPTSWGVEWWKPSSDRRRNLVKAGALILAEIERLDRAALAAHRKGKS